ncbi:hypothetical protein [Nocardia rhizosphaerihabitans]|uniref:Condensation domain-containing protein n=1 Tax=Nocardia rhizosphaerihabitans TaxID=1691570 RepID=A0ABQ2KA09_9NOCA|nr:hypothetical protein [Nocardia rhizosphaerihabitans]GGN73978.1 hypothetical protein GCM10011610_17100 [Nocardia rhizosphaerihabitans]
MTNRLTVVDEIFLRTHRGMGTPIALQGLWRTDDAMELVLLQAIHDRLRTGALGRRVVRARVPGARRAWRPNIQAHPLDHVGSPLPEAAILPWADTLGTDLDPEFGPGWRLSSAPLEDGGTVVALTCSHALADARGLIHAVAAALDELASSADDPHSAPTAGSTSRLITPRQAAMDTDSPVNSCGAPASDWADARTQWSTIIGGTARALRRGVPRPPATGTPSPSRDRAVHSTLLTFDAAEWDTTAAASGGTPNSLFIHLVANILWENGFQRPEIAASLPVDTRDEPRVDNDLAMTEIAMDRSDTPATIRDKARAAYLRRMSSPAGLPEEILQVLPDRWAYALSKGAGERDILCSNIGTLPESLRTVGTHRCDRVAARAIHPGLTDFPRTQLSGYLSRLADTYTLALVSLSGDRETLDAATDRACAAAGLRAAPW